LRKEDRVGISTLEEKQGSPKENNLSEKEFLASSL